MMLRMRRELGTDESPVAPEIDSLVLIDRSVVRSGAARGRGTRVLTVRQDLVTPMCTQLTYEGLIDEIYGINYCAPPSPSVPRGPAG